MHNRFIARLPVFNELYQIFLFSALKKMFIAEGIQISHIINFSYNSNMLFQHFHDQTIVYYCNDDFIYTGRFKPLPVRAYIRHIENQVIKKSHCCIGTSDYLVSKLKKHNSNSRRILLGADNTISDEYQIFTSKDKNRRPIRVVYVGFMMRNKFDIKWIEGCMDSQELFFTFVGPVDEATRVQFKHHRNTVEFVGQQTGITLHNVLSAGDVCIAPYNKSGLKRYEAFNGWTPNKLWLYLEAGKPVVLTHFQLPEGLSFEPGMIYMVDDNCKLADTIRSAYLDDSESLFKARIQMAKSNSWQRRLKQLLDCLPVDAGLRGH